MLPMIMLPQSLLVPIGAVALDASGFSGSLLAAPHAALFGGVTRLLAADPFSDPVWGVAAQAGASADELSPMMTGLACYAIGMVALTIWDEKVLPGLQKQGLLPYVDKEELAAAAEESRREAERNSKPLTPLTASRQPLPEQLDEQACHYIGTVDGVKQYLCVRIDEKVGEECKLSEEFSAFYKRPVVICKKAEKGRFQP